jgi:tetratricopeptide (TPR) repeat protein
MLLWLLFLLGSFDPLLSAEPMDPLANQIETDWSKTYFSNLSKQQKKISYEQLLKKLDVQLNQAPNNASLWLWKGILTANYAEHVGPLDALSKVKEAKGYFEKSKSIDPKVYYGSASINLGILYTEVPGGLISFGDLDKAEEMFLAAKKVDPNSIDLNFYYGKLLEKKENYSGAKKFYLKALQQKPRAHQTFADKNLKEVVKRQLESLRGKTNGAEAFSESLESSEGQQ